ncbi:protein disulfide-isomerase TMX3 [Cylas formicarius]|uniref:protein disulfide-isomerase TMX3 n=1 Tax=Cylas formicarius TaxID=197179 RepID=UPI002958D4E4|nr:protein disulfide-isomerase TMX3 [Cylas formicarius]
MDCLLIKIFLLYLVIRQCRPSRVLELSDKFTEIRKDGAFWLVKFYAPWCGHCKRLEPIWAQVAQALSGRNVRVGKVDCTRFPSIAEEFRIGGYPTIKFVKPDGDHTYHGDRTRDELVNYAIRMSGPPVQEVTRPESFNGIKRDNRLFFMYVGAREGPLWDVYFDVASKLQPHGFFYSTNEDIAKQHLDVGELPAVFVYKESLHYFYSVDSGTNVEEAENLNQSLHRWVNEERFETFPKITRGNMNEIMQTNKYIVLVVVEEDKIKRIPAHMLKFRDTVEELVRKKRGKYHRYFQFGWVGSPDLANSIAMEKLPLPHLLVLNSTTYHHHIPDDDPTEMTAEAIDHFLWRIINRSVPAYGGNSIPVRLYRTYFEGRAALGDMWKGNPILTAVIFGLPFGFLSLILYSICCADILDADDDDDDYEYHAKRE